MSPRQQRGEATVDRLLTAALRVFSDSGQQGFTVSAVTSASGVSLGSLYHHFGSFDGLAVALYTRCMEQLFEEMTAALTRTRTARTGICALVRCYLRFTEEHPDVALFLHASAYSGYLADHADEIRRVKAERLRGIAEWLRPRVEAGEIVAIPSPLIDVLILGPAAETARRWLSSAYDIDLAEAARILPDRVWRSLQPD
ncbi:TetR/AcrR family transcriptional regulator [Streptomyces sp. NPDC059070]|uniref:TetR/AcrR family transcriptional regulator n=1 Tax=Streptomyces sp. NPDC059070 TaxID=3346713 RepID=UPI0036CEA081